MNMKAFTAVCKTGNTPPLFLLTKWLQATKTQLLIKLLMTWIDFQLKPCLLDKANLRILNFFLFRLPSLSS